MKKDIHNELNELSPFLADKLKAKDGFVVPDNYFETLSENILKETVPIQEPLKAHSTVSVPKESLMDRLANAIQALLQPRMAMGFASVLLLLFAGIYFFQQDTKTADPFITFSASDVEKYIEENIDRYDINSLVEADILQSDDFDFNDVDQMKQDEIDTYLDDILLEEDELF